MSAPSSLRSPGLIPSIFTTGDVPADNSGKLDEAILIQLIDGERHVGRAESDGLVLDLLDASPEPMDW